MTDASRDPNSGLDRSHHGEPTEVLSDLAYLKTVFVNVIFVGAPTAGDRGWVLVQTGIPHTHHIRKAAEARFGANARPAARESVRALDALRPALAVTGHGRPMAGDRLLTELDELCARFDELAVPDHGKYVPPAIEREHDEEPRRGEQR